MIELIKGNIVEIQKDSVVVVSNDIGYKIYTTNPYSFKLDEQFVVYTHLHVKEDNLTLFGFLDKEEKKVNIVFLLPRGDFSVVIDSV